MKKRLEMLNILQRAFLVCGLLATLVGNLGHVLFIIFLVSSTLQALAVCPAVAEQLTALLLPLVVKTVQLAWVGDGMVEIANLMVVTPLCCVAIGWLHAVERQEWLMQ